MTLVDLDERVQDANPSACGLLGYARDELVGKTIRDITHPEDLDADLEQLKRLLGGETSAYQVEKRYVRSDGRMVWGLLSRSLVRDDHGKPLYFISQIQDISDRKALEEQLLHRASHDPLTGLYNRSAFAEQLDRGLSLARRSGSPLALLFLDLDDFKRVNDTLGHDAGDRLLAEVAERLLDCVRAEDVVARLGGDEFCVLLENLPDAEGALRIAERIKTCLEEPFAPGLRDLPRLTASIGIVVAGPGEHTSAGRLLNQADAAMYRAKRSGKAHHRLHLDLAGEEGGS